MKHEIKPGWVLLTIIVAFGIVGNIEYRDQQAEEKRMLSVREQKAAAYLISKGVENPVDKAVTILNHSKFPKVALATAVVESRVRPHAVGKAKEKGAFQVREIYWDDVSKELSEQTRQHSTIVETLLKENNWNWLKTIKAYNGEGKKADIYAQLVMANMKEVGL